MLSNLSTQESEIHSIKEILGKMKTQIPTQTEIIAKLLTEDTLHHLPLYCVKEIKHQLSQIDCNTRFIPSNELITGDFNAITRVINEYIERYIVNPSKYQIRTLNDITTGYHTEDMPGLTGMLTNAMVFIKEYDLLICGTRSGELITMDIMALSDKKHIVKVVEEHPVLNLTYLNDHKILLVICKPWQCDYFSVPRLQKLRKISTSHELWIHVDLVTPNVATCGDQDNYINFMDVIKTRNLYRITHPLPSKFSSTLYLSVHKYLLAGDSEGHLAVYDMTTRSRLSTLEVCGEEWGDSPYKAEIGLIVHDSVTDSIFAGCNDGIVAKISLDSKGQLRLLFKIFDYKYLEWVTGIHLIPERDEILVTKGNDKIYCRKFTEALIVKDFVLDRIDQHKMKFTGITSIAGTSIFVIADFDLSRVYFIRYDQLRSINC
jgi:hypothetical protein